MPLTPDPVRLASGAGRFRGRTRIDASMPSKLGVDWPEGHTLLLPQTVDPASAQPGPNATITLEKA